MKIEYDQETDTLVISFSEAKIEESDEIRPGIIADFGYYDNIIRLEILNASNIVEKNKEVQLAVEA